MFKQKASYEIKVGERSYQFICEGDSPLDELLDVLSMMQKNVQKMKDDAVAKAKEADPVSEIQEVK